MEVASEHFHHQRTDNSQVTLENILISTKLQHQDQKKPRAPPTEEALRCPRCDSTNTKFCYYNNYSLSQPRYFCKSCRRYWTKGGTLRNVPVGGGCRHKTKRPSSSSRRNNIIHDQQPLLATTTDDHLSNTLNPFSFESSEFTLALARLQQNQAVGQLGINGNFIENSSPGSTVLPAGVVFDGFLEHPIHNSLYNPSYVNINIPSCENALKRAATTTMEDDVPTMKREAGNDGDENNRMLWGNFPKMLMEGMNIGNMGYEHLDFGIQYWNGLINSSLM